ncbi:putative Ig domain-containing protein [Stenotrophomonas sp.]|uniref:putative Ig domain-containing protein n=1 Tax=Stenotrophomonas sp. TaxID=69392 RepID=UPI0028978206|nr:putative Ig domain-containing protein [Stenotrophomonas sp.]
MSFLSGTARSARLFAFVSLLSCLALFWPDAARAAHTSLLCGPQTVHVPSGGSVAINVTACAGSNIFLAGDGPVDGPALPQRGSAILRIDDPNWYVDYSHNGVDTQGDIFEFSDTANRIVRVTMIVDPPASSIVISPATLNPMTAGTAFAQTLSASGGTAPYTYTTNPALLPPGLVLSSTGTLSGTPTRRGAFSFTVRVTDNGGDVVDKAYALTVQNPSLSLSQSAATAVQNQPFSLTLIGQGGVAPYTFTLETGSLPTGITLNGTTGLLSGTPTSAVQAYPVTLRVTDSSAGAAPYYELENFTLTVSTAPAVSITVSPASVLEGSGVPMVYTVTSSASVASALTVNLTTSGTATSGIDYTGGASSIVIPANATSASLSILPVDDTVVEADETVILTVAPGAGYTVGTPSSATGTILNDDRPVATIAVAPATVDEDSGTPLVFTVTLDRTNPTPLSIPISIGGTASFGVDYTGVLASVAIPAGATTGTLSLVPIADTTVEPDKTVVVTLLSGTGFSVGSPASATGTIRDDDLPALSVSDVSQNEGNSGTTLFNFVVSLNAPAGPGGVTFDIATADNTANAGSDYVARSLVSQTIPAGSQTYSFAVQVNGDIVYELNETFTVNVSNVVGATVAKGQGVGTIVNDDAMPALSIGDVSVNEGNSGTTPVVLTVTLSSPSSQPIQVQYATVNGTATAPSDYTAASGTLNFLPGVTTRTITVLVNGDTQVEPDETFLVNLSTPINAVLGDASATVTILNDDQPMGLLPTALTPPKAGMVYTQTFSASGGTAPYTYSITAGSLPPGLVLNTGAGVLSGMPTVVGTYPVSVTATDSGSTPNTVTQMYTVVVAAPTLLLPSPALPAAIRGQAFSSARGPASGGTAPYIFSITAGALPPGLTLSPAGVISGTPSQTGPYAFTVTARDSTLGTGAPFGVSESLSLTVAEAVPLAGNVSLTTGYNAPAAPVALALTGGAATSVAVATAAAHGTATNLDATTITYQPAAGYAGPDSFTYTATGPGGTSTAGTVTITVDNPTITVAAGGSLAGVAGTSYSQTFTWSGGALPYGNYQVTNLPDGVAITATTADSVTISGTPTRSGTFPLVATATDSSGGVGPFTVGQTFALVLASPTLSATPATLPAATAGSAYQQTITGSGGIAPYQVVLTGTLPAGMSFDAGTATLSGTPTQSGAFTLNATLTDSTGGTPASITQSYTLVVASPTLSATPATLPAATAGSAYQQVITASGGIAPYQVTLSGSLPTGMSFNPATGTLSGTPSQSGTFGLIVTLTDSTTGTPASATQVYSLVVASPTLSAAPATLPAATAGSAYQQAITASGGIAPYQVTLSGALPTGVTFDAATGTLSGTPLQSGSFALTATITDSTTGMPASLTQSYSLVVASPTLSATPAALPAGTAGTAYQQAITATGGIAPYQVTLSGALPTGMTFDAATGALSGTPTQSGSFALTATITDSTGGTPASLTQSYSLVIASPVLVATPSALAGATAGTPYQQPITATGGIAPYQVVLSGALPTGVVFDAATGTLSGTPTQSGSFALTATITDSTTGTPASITRSYTLSVASPVLVTPLSVLPGGTAGSVYQQAFTATGGIAPYHVALAGTLPAGLSFDAATGTLSGTPTQSGSFPLTVTITDSTAGTPASLTQSYSLVVASPALVATPATLAPATAGTPYQQAFSATGGIAPYRVVLTGTLPAGLVFDAGTGMVSGTPTQSGTFALSASITDSTSGTPASVVQAYSLAVAAPALTLTPAAGALPGATAGSSYAVDFVTEGGLAPYRYAVSTGSLPAGLALDATTGRVSGTPSVAGSFAFSVTVADATAGGAGAVTQAYTVNVSAPVLALTPSSLPAGVFASRYEQALTATGGTAPYRYAVSAGALPTGMALDAAGMLAGTPTAAGAFAFTVTVTDALGFTGSRDYIVQIADRPDPTRDPEVRGLLSAQRDAARRFANSQIENFQQRMQRLHGASGNDGFSNNLSLSYAQRRCEPMVGAVPGQDCDAQRRQPFDREPSLDAPAAAATSASQAPLGLWVGGTIRSGRSDGGQRAGTDFETDGVTVGSDLRISDAFAVGAGLGYGRDRSDVGESGSRSDGQAYSMAVYASYSPGRSLFVDALLGHQLLDYSLRRYVTGDGGFVHARRNGSQWFGSLAFGADLAKGSWQFTPYARLDASQGTLDSYVEQGSDLFALRYGDQDVDATTGNAGLRMETRRTATWGAWTPQLRVEYQHDFSGSGLATLQYADLVDLPFYRTTLDGFDRSRWMLGAGVMFDFGRTWGLRVDYRGLVGSGNDRDHGVQISLDKQL